MRKVSSYGPVDVDLHYFFVEAVDDETRAYY